MSPIESPAVAHVLQPRAQPADDHPYLPATATTTRWGRLPCEQDSPVLVVEPGATVVVDTVSHEGILEDQGRDPVAYFAGHGVAVTAVPADAIAIAADGSHEPSDGPHVVTGPIAVTGARPGDLVAVRIKKLVPRVPYGVISSRHGRGLLPRRLPVAADTVSIFCAVEGLDEGLRQARATIPLRAGAADQRARFPLAPFLGLIGVSTPGAERLHSTPPGLHGGNIDIALLQAGTTLYLPVQIPEAGVYLGDPHFAQGNGEIALTALEASLRATVTLDLIPEAQAIEQFGPGRGVRLCLHERRDGLRHLTACRHRQRCACPHQSGRFRD